MTNRERLARWLRFMRLVQRVTRQVKTAQRVLKEDSPQTLRNGHLSVKEGSSEPPKTAAHKAFRGIE